MLGRFHEIGIGTADIRASVEFYEKLGFTHAIVGDTWPHPYGVLTDGRICIGLHQCALPSPALTFVHPGVAKRTAEFEARGFELVTCRTDEDVFNEIELRDPAGQMVRILEARTYSPAARQPEQTSLCGYFSEFSMPADDFEALAAFWEPLGFVVAERSDEPYAHLSLTSDHLNISFHRRRALEQPMLVFRDPDMPGRIARLRELGLRPSADLPRGLRAADNALLEAPEGTSLLLLTEQS